MDRNWETAFGSRDQIKRRLALDRETSESLDESGNSGK